MHKSSSSFIHTARLKTETDTVTTDHLLVASDGPMVTFSLLRVRSFGPLWTRRSVSSSRWPRAAETTLLTQQKNRPEVKVNSDVVFWHPFWFFFYQRKNPWWLKNHKRIYKLFGSAPYSGRLSSINPSRSRKKLTCYTTTEIRWNKNEDSQAYVAYNLIINVTKMAHKITTI